MALTYADLEAPVDYYQQQMHPENPQDDREWRAYHFQIQY
jgi:hypothetical protein